MRKAALFGLAVLVLGAPLPASAGDLEAAVGEWRTPDFNGIVEIFTCGDALCGRIVTSDALKTDPWLTDAKNPDPKQRGRRLLGLTFLTGFSGGPRDWKGGRLYRPEDGAIYRGSLRLESLDRLVLTGCLVALLCQSQTWTRVR